jgi:hypothetical protein
MNRNGSRVVQDPKGRDRERYPIVYDARLKVKEGKAVDRGQVCWLSGTRRMNRRSRATTFWQA